MVKQIEGASLQVEARIRISRALQNAVSLNTRTNYASRWTQFEKWIDAKGYDSILPIDPIVVAEYVTERADEGATVATVKAGAVAISARHREAGLESPTEHEGVRKVIKGISREHGRAAKQARPLDKEALAAIEATATVPRIGRGGKMESQATATKRGRVDTALARVSSDAGLRRSEISALKWENVSENPDGTGLICIESSKTDQESEGVTLALTRTAMRALADLDSERSGKIFDLSPAQVHRRIGAAAKAAGLGDGFSGHSGRVGLAHRAAKNGAPMPATMRMGRWKSAAMVARYSAAVTATDDLRWLE